jgi:hypothetical protein
VPVFLPVESKKVSAIQIKSLNKHSFKYCKERGNIFLLEIDISYDNNSNIVLDKQYCRDILEYDLIQS